jgi:hypothetical protein
MIAHGKLPYLRMALVLLFYLVFSLPPESLSVCTDPDQALDTESSYQQAKKKKETLISAVPLLLCGCVTLMCSVSLQLNSFED